jgi:hypothetical protein
MASRLLGDGGLPAKHEVAQPGAHRHRDHDPPVVGHEDEHDHEGVKVLDAVQHRLGDVRSPRDLLPVLACTRCEEGGCLSS